MRQEGRTAKRYAKALFLLVRETGRVEAIGDELNAFLEVLSADRRLAEFLTWPWVRGAAKQAVAQAVAERLGCSKAARDFLGLVAARGRMSHAPGIAQAYRDLVDRGLGRLRAPVRTAVALTGTERTRLAGRLGQVAGKEVIVEESVDPTLLGGFVAQIGSLVLDGSLDGQLARMRERLVRG
jgi:F-type H+-transporting ATPase subunit delta